MIRSRNRTRGGVVTSSTPTFDPSSISGLQLWLDANDTATITSSAGAVSQWNDKSGNLNHVTQGTSADQPTTGTKTINSKNAVDFDGTSDFLIAPSGLYTLGSGANTVIMLYASDSTTAAQRLWSARTSTGVTGNLGAVMLNGVGLVPSVGSVHHSSAFNYNYLTPTLNTSAHTTGYIRSGATCNTFYDGPPLSTLSSPAPTADNISPGVIYIGRFAGGASDYFDGVLCEVIIYNKALSNSEFNQIGAYLSAKWGVGWVNFNEPSSLLVEGGSALLTETGSTIVEG